MDLQKKTLIVLVTFLILAVALTGLFVTVILLSNYQSLEKEYMTNDVMRTVSQLKNDERTLSAIASDWAPWDDTYDFVSGNRPEYIERNINPDAFANLHLSFMVITNRSGGVVYAGTYDPSTRTIVPVSPALLQDIVPESPLLDQSDPRGETTGILMLPEGPALVTSHPIVRTDFSGTPQGVVIMGQYLGSSEIQRLSSRMSSSVEIQKIAQSDLTPAELAGLTAVPSVPPLVIRPVSDNTVAGYALLWDIYGNPVLTLRITEPRDLYRQGTSTIFQFIMILLLTEMLFGFVMIFFLDRFVLSRINTLSSQVRRIGTGSDWAARVKLEDSDELTDLARDINLMLTEIEKTNADLLSSEARFRELAEETSDVLLTLDTKGTAIYVSPAINRYGYLSEDVISQDFVRFVHPGDRTRVIQEFHREIEECTPIVLPFRLVDKWGYIHWIEAKISVRMDVFGKPTGITGVLRDFTDRRQAEDAIVLANRKLNLLNNITRHDILNTITALLGCVDMANATKVPAEREELLKEIKELTRIIQRQIEFTREYQSVGVNAPTWQNLREILNRAIINFAGSGITISKDIENTEIYADPLLEKVFYNLIDNAIRYGEHITTIRFYYQVSDVGLTLICEDDGVGIPEKDKESIFERGVGKNTGMGLFLTREILSITGITIWEMGKAGAGARFEMLIPNGAFRFIKDRKDEPKEG